MPHPNAVVRRTLLRSVALGLFAAILAAAPAGANTNVTISSAATSNAVFAGGTYSFTGVTANVNTTELNNNLAAANVTVNAVNGQANAGTITVIGPTTVSWGAHALNLTTSTAAGDIAINGPMIGNGGGSPTLTMTTGGSITQTAPIQSGNVVTLNAGEAITLPNANNDFVFIGATTGPFEIRLNDINSILFNSIATAGDLTVTTDGPIGQNFGVNALVGGTTALDTSPGPQPSSINLDSAGNDFTGPVAFSGSNTVLADSNALALGPGSASTLALAPGGPLTQAAATAAGKVIVSNATTVNAPGTTVDLSNPFNDFVGNVTISPAAAATIADANSLGIGTSQVTGATSLSAPDSIAAGSVTNEFQGPGSATTAGALTLRDDTDLALGTIATHGADVFADNALTQTGPITDTGLFKAQGDSVTLTNTANDFSQADLKADAGAIDARDANSVGILGVDATGAAKVIAGTAIDVLPAAAPFTAAALTLVTDEAAGSSVGSGGIAIPASRSLVSTGAPLRIYTARRGQNAIAPGALLNGAGFSPGPEFVNSATEVWNTRYPAGTATSPFTIFLKDHETTPPQTTIDSGPADGSTIANPAPTFGFSADEASTFECAVDGAAFAPCASPMTLAALSDGAHSFSARATDTAGNADATPAGRTFTVDTTPAVIPDTTSPDTQITKTPKRKVKTAKRKVPVTFEFRSTEAGSSLACRIDGGSFAPCTSPMTFKAKKGTHRFAVRATDAAGNTDGSPARFDFTVKRKK